MTKLRWAARYLALALGVAAPLAFMAIFFLWPVLTMVSMGLFGEGGGSGFAEALGRRRVWDVVAMTVGMAAGGTVGSVLLGLPGAYVLYKLKIPFRGALRAFVSIPFVLPVMAVAVGVGALRPRRAIGILAPDGHENPGGSRNGVL